MMLLPESNIEQEAFCIRLGTDFIVTPKDKGEWVSAVDKMCTAYS
jgi:hypothetical protein